MPVSLRNQPPHPLVSVTPSWQSSSWALTVAYSVPTSSTAARLVLPGDIL